MGAVMPDLMEERLVVGKDFLKSALRQNLH
jgi:hypothetical protein